RQTRARDLLVDRRGVRSLHLRLGPIGPRLRLSVVLPAVAAAVDRTQGARLAEHDVLDVGSAEAVAAHIAWAATVRRAGDVHGDLDRNRVGLAVLVASQGERDVVVAGQSGVLVLAADRGPVAVVDVERAGLDE